MDLSVIIVNYNVKYFLEHCLASVQRAIKGLQCEVFVVDNASSDGSNLYFENRFPFVNFIYSNENNGFAKGNNIAVKKASGNYILFLNPDTLVPEDAFTQCISFFESHLDCGALGVKMIDGAGNFLKESKRSFPSPVTSFYKLSGLTRLFPGSPVFAKYHLGNLSDQENHEVDVLAGAYMMVRKKVIDEIGSFDENFFMYGEDVDLSYRIQQAGYKNYYLAQPVIIHFKGESTKRGSLNYVRMFYKAMSQFVTKQYGQTKARTFNIFIQLAILIRASFSGLRRSIKWIGLPLIDAGIILFCIWGVKLFWFAKIKPLVRYNREILVSAAIVYTVTYILVCYLSGLYDKPFKQKNLNRSAIASTLVLLALYGLLPETYRFSRGIIFLSAVFIFITLSLLRFLLTRTGILDAGTDEEEEKQTVVIADLSSYNAILQLYDKAGIRERILGLVDTNNSGKGLVNFSDFKNFSATIPFKNILYSANCLSYESIIEQLHLRADKYRIKFYVPEAFSIIGSDSKNTIGESITHHGKFRIENSDAIRCKRLLDLFVSIFLLLFSPIIYWLLQKRARFFPTVFAVLTGSKTFVGYCSKEKSTLPPIKEAVIGNNGIELNASVQEVASAGLLYELDYRYAKLYHCYQDLPIIARYYFKK